MDKVNSNQLGLGHAVQKLESYFQEGLALIKGLQDEARLEVHLGQMDAKKRWAALETELSKAEHQALQDAPVALDRAVQALRSVSTRAIKPVKSPSVPAKS